MTRLTLALAAILLLMLTASVSSSPIQPAPVQRSGIDGQALVQRRPAPGDDVLSLAGGHAQPPASSLAPAGRAAAGAAGLFAAGTDRRSGLGRGKRWGAEANQPPTDPVMTSVCASSGSAGASAPARAQRLPAEPGAAAGACAAL